MRSSFDFGFNDLNHDGNIDACEAAYGFQIMNDIMGNNEHEEDYSYSSNRDEEENSDRGFFEDDEDDGDSWDDEM